MAVSYILTSKGGEAKEMKRNGTRAVEGECERGS